MAKASIVPQKSTSLPSRVIFKQLPGRLIVLIGGGVKDVLFGTAFLLPGLALMLIGFHIVPVSGENFLINGVSVLGWFGVPFFLAGSAVICYRRWLMFDLGRGELVIKFGLLTPMFRRERSLREFTSVTIALQVQSVSSGDGHSSGYYEYPVVLTTGAHGNALTVNDRATYPQAYFQAATIAKFLGLPVRDQSTDHPVEITPADLARPLRTRLRADEATQQQLATPAALRSQIEASPNGSRISIPGKTNNSRMDSLVPFIATVAIIIFLIILRTCFQSAHIPAVLQYWMMGLAALFGGVPVLVMLTNDWVDRRTNIVVSVDNQGIRVEECRGKRTRNKMMFPIEDIIDIDYNLVEDRRRSKFSGSVLGKIIGSKGIMLKTKIGLYSFGAGLPDAEVAYLAMVVERALSLALMQLEAI